MGYSPRLEYVLCINFDVTPYQLLSMQIYVWKVTSDAYETSKRVIFQTYIYIDALRAQAGVLVTIVSHVRGVLRNDLKIYIFKSLVWMIDCFKHPKSLS